MSRSGVDKDSGKDPQVEMLDDAVKPNSADDVVIQDRELKERRLVRRIEIRMQALSCNQPCSRNVLTRCSGCR